MVNKVIYIPYSPELKLLFEDVLNNTLGNYSVEEDVRKVVVSTCLDLASRMIYDPDFKIPENDINNICSLISGNGNLNTWQSYLTTENKDEFNMAMRLINILNKSMEDYISYLLNEKMFIINIVDSKKDYSIEKATTEGFMFSYVEG